MRSLSHGSKVDLWDYKGAHMALNPGTKVGPHQVVASARAGGMGEVYRARDARLNREVAVKVLPTGRLFVRSYGASPRQESSSAAARWPLAIAPCTVPLCPLKSVASPAKNRVFPTGAASRRAASLLSARG